MLILAWNCQGVGRPLTFRALKGSVRAHRPSIILLMESRNKENKMERFRRALNYPNSFYVNPIGLAGGLALWWDSSISISVDVSSNNVVHTSCQSLHDNKSWAMSFVYGSPSYQDKEMVWDFIRNIADGLRGPWVCLGDFNEVAMASDKSGGNLPSSARISSFNDFLNDCGLLDLGFKGQRFTWRNNRTGDAAVMERLDKAYANIDRREDFPQAMVFHEPAIGSDHSPILLSTEEPLKIHRQFRFESMWTAEEECGDIIRSHWACLRSEDNSTHLVKNLEKCRGILQRWHREKFGKMKERMTDLKAKIGVIQQSKYSTASKLEEEELLRSLNVLWEQEEMYWHQRSRLNYLRFGDKNTRFFHITATQRRQRNLILRLKNEQDEWISHPKGISAIIRNHFSDIFSDPIHSCNFDNVLRSTSNKISAEQNVRLCRGICIEEIKSAVFELGSLKAPGPDGFPGLFYQKYWDHVKDSVGDMVKDFFEGKANLDKLNRTNLILIPKIPNPEAISQFRPISLCNFAFKIISKILANRLKPLLPTLISQQQSAFIQGRQIHDNIIVAHEVFHYIKHKKRGPKSFMALKLDLSKAFDRVRWNFLEERLRKLGFEEKWIEWVMLCIKTVNFSVVVNGGRAVDLIPSRGIRQGDPLSPYLFLVVADCLSSMISDAVDKKELGGVRVRNRGPMLSHLLFADDSLIFLEASLKNCQAIKKILRDFGDASGEEINFQKSEIVFSPNTPVDLQKAIQDEMGMGIMKEATKYLGLPTNWGKSKQQTLSYVRDKILAKLQGWKGVILSPAGKEILINDVAFTIPAFPMTCFKFPLVLCKKISSTIAKFWWGETERGSKIHWVRWDALTEPKEVGGLGFRDLRAYNLALLAKTFWRMMQEPNALWAQVLKSSYFPSSSPMEARKGASPSWIWSSILEGRDLLKKRMSLESWKWDVHQHLGR